MPAAGYAVAVKRSVPADAVVVFKSVSSFTCVPVSNVLFSAAVQNCSAVGLCFVYSDG